MNTFKIKNQYSKLKNKKARTISNDAILVCLFKKYFFVVEFEHAFVNWFNFKQIVLKIKKETTENICLWSDMILPCWRQKKENYKTLPLIFAVCLLGNVFIAGCLLGNIFTVGLTGFRLRNNVTKINQFLC